MKKRTATNPKLKKTAPFSKELPKAGGAISDLETSLPPVFVNPLHCPTFYTEKFMALAGELGLG